MKTVEEIIEHLQNEQAYCYMMHETYKGKDSEKALEYIIRAITISSLLSDIE